MICFPTRKFFWLVISLLVFLNVPVAIAQQEKNVVSSFEKRVALFEKFFSVSPKFLEKQSFSKSPTGYIFFWCRYDDSKISYDIQKTGSLISPYMGYITVKYIDTISICGDVERKFSTIEAARQNRDNDSCYSKDIIGENKFVFAFQKGAWIFKEVLNTFNNEPDRRLATVMGSPEAGRFPVDDNDFWKTLISR